jgi:hypothetical protein
MSKEKELFKKIIDESIAENNMSTFYMLFVSLISYDNNMEESEIKENCRLIDILINLLNDYPNNKELQKNRRQLIEYNKIYSK